MGQPHKHAELIKDWADGSDQVIEGREHAAKLWQVVSITFVITHSSWEYRIRPAEKKPVVRWLWARDDGEVTNAMHESAIGNFKIKLEWSRTEFPE